jgi:hypothetical protein
MQAPKGNAATGTMRRRSQPADRLSDGAERGHAIFSSQAKPDESGGRSPLRIDPHGRPGSSCPNSHNRWLRGPSLTEVFTSGSEAGPDQQGPSSHVEPGRQNSWLSSAAKIALRSGGRCLLMRPAATGQTRRPTTSDASPDIGRNSGLPAAGCVAGRSPRASKGILISIVCQSLSARRSGEPARPERCLRRSDDWSGLASSGIRVRLVT